MPNDPSCPVCRRGASPSPHSPTAGATTASAGWAASAPASRRSTPPRSSPPSDAPQLAPAERVLALRMAGHRAGIAGQEGPATLAAVGATTITRRRALVLGALAGVGSLVARPLNAFGRAVPGRVRGFGMDVGPGDFDGAISRVLRAPRRFDLLGVRGARALRLEVRVRRDGARWSPWVPLAVHGDHAPDTGPGEP